MNTRPTMADAVQAYLEGERQWTRQCRIDHARLLLRRCIETDRPFWAAVLTKLGANDAEKAPQ